MSNQNVFSVFSNPTFPSRVLEWVIAAVAVLGTLGVVGHAFATVTDAALRAQLVVQGVEVIAATLLAAVISGGLHALASRMEADLPSGRALAAA